MNRTREAWLLTLAEAAAPFAAGGLLLLCGIFAFIASLKLWALPSNPLDGLSAPAALIVAGAGIGLMLAARELSLLRQELAQTQARAARAEEERAQAMKQSCRLRAQAEGLALMREIHRSTALPDRRDRLRRMLTLLGDLFEAREVLLFATAGNSPLRAAPAACLRLCLNEETFVIFEAQAFEGAAETGEAARPFAFQLAELKLTEESGWLHATGQLWLNGRAAGRIHWRGAWTAEGGAPPRRTPAEILADALRLVRFTPAACRRAGAALEERRTLSARVSSAELFGESGDELLELHVPLLADQRPLGVLRLLRLEEGLEGPAAETLQELLVESAKHVALALKKDADDQQAITDQLTGLYIKRHFLAELEQCCGEAVRERRPFALLMVDIDHFKRVNDTHGHLSGDWVLRGVARVLRGGLRTGDLAFRYGGEELALLLRNTPLEVAQQIAERLRLAVQQTVFTGEHSQPIPLTISLGLAEWESGQTPERLISRADAALYESKRAGRNRCTTSGQESRGASAHPAPAPAPFRGRRTG